jgi:hypothetical protein
MASLDKVQKERVDLFWERLGTNYSSWKSEELFLSERVFKTLPEDKILLAHFDLSKILSVLPFSPNTYVEICPNCFSPKDLPAFSTLVRKGAIIPILVAPYDRFPQPIVDALRPYDHVSRYEYGAYRWLALQKLAEKGVCSHCAKLAEQNINKHIRQTKSAEKFRKFRERLFGNLYPFINEDFELIQRFKYVAKKRDLAAAAQLANLSYSIHEFRSSQAFNAQFIIDSTMLDSLPQEFHSTQYEDVDFSLRAKKQIADGFGLKIPTVEHLESYIEIAKDFQPRIAKVIGSVIVSSNQGTAKSMTEIIRTQMELNTEIERIIKLKRYLALETAVDIFTRNKALAATALIAGAAGLASGAMGCAIGAAGGAVIKAATTVAKRKGWLNDSESAKKFTRALKNEIQPYVDIVVAKYVGSYVPAVSILSLRKDLTAVPPS